MILITCLEMNDIKNDSAMMEAVQKGAVVLNSQDIPFCYMISNLLNETGIPQKYLGALREHLGSARRKNLALTEMIVLIMTQVIPL